MLGDDGRQVVPLHVRHQWRERSPTCHFQSAPCVMVDQGWSVFFTKEGDTGFLKNFFPLKIGLEGYISGN